MRRFETSWPDDPEAIVSERLEALAYDVERIALTLEGENPEARGGPLDRLVDAEERKARALERLVEELVRSDVDGAGVGHR